MKADDAWLNSDIVVAYPLRDTFAVSGRGTSVEKGLDPRGNNEDVPVISDFGDREGAFIPPDLRCSRCCTQLSQASDRAMLSFPGAITCCGSSVRRRSRPFGVSFSCSDPNFSTSWRARNVDLTRSTLACRVDAHSDKWVAGHPPPAEFVIRGSHRERELLPKFIPLCL